MVPDCRILPQNDFQPRPGSYVLYWMVAYRRPHYNFALERAVEWALKLDLPLVIFEPLRVAYPWASDRLHRFVIDGMKDNQAFFKKRQVTYIPYVEPKPGAGKGLLDTLLKKAAVLVSDDYPCFFLPKMQAAVAKPVELPFELIDSNGLMPMRLAKKAFTRAFDFRRYLQKTLPPHLKAVPKKDSTATKKLTAMASWPRGLKQFGLPMDLQKIDLQTLPIDHAVSVSEIPGGFKAAQKHWKQFLTHKLSDYGEQRNHPDADGASGLSPYLHFGHISTHQVMADLAKAYDWRPEKLSAHTKGGRSGWWNFPETVESFLDEVVTWREVGFNGCTYISNYDQLDSLPNWAQQTIAAHKDDVRPYHYTLKQFENAQTHDPIWNAAQTELVQTGRMHNYLRMLWGKKIYEWSRTAQDALNTMIELNNKYALDGRDPNSYSGIFWVLGRYDRAWGPERPVFGKLRYMTSDSTKRKLKLNRYLKRYTLVRTSARLESEQS